MKFKTGVKKTVEETFDIDGFIFKTHYGGQSTDYSLYLQSDGEVVKEFDVRGIEGAIQILHQLVAHPKNCKCDSCID